MNNGDQYFTIFSFHIQCTVALVVDNPATQDPNKIAMERFFEELKALLVEDVDRFGEAFVEQLATYALRRVMTIDDRKELEAIAAASKDGGYRLQDIIVNLVTSSLFSRR